MVKNTHSMYWTKFNLFPNKTKGVGLTFNLLLLLFLLLFKGFNSDNLLGNNYSPNIDSLTKSFLQNHNMDLFPNPLILLINPDNCPKDVSVINAIINQLENTNTQIITVYINVRQSELHIFKQAYPYFIFKNSFIILDDLFFNHVNSGLRSSIIYLDTLGYYMKIGVYGFYSKILNNSYITPYSSPFSIIKNPESLNERLGLKTDHYISNSAELIAVDRRYQKTFVFDFNSLSLKEFNNSVNYNTTIAKKISNSELQFALENIGLMNRFGFPKSIITCSSYGFNKLAIEHIIYYAHLDSIKQSGDSAISILSQTVIDIFNYHTNHHEYIFRNYDQLKSGYYYLPWISFGNTKYEIIHHLASSLSFEDYDTIFSCASFYKDSVNSIYRFDRFLLPFERRIIEENLQYSIKHIAKEIDDQKYFANPYSINVYNNNSQKLLEINIDSFCELSKDRILLDFYLEDSTTIQMLILCNSKVDFVHYDIAKREITHVFNVPDNIRLAKSINIDSLYLTAVFQDDNNSFIFRVKKSDLGSTFK